MGRVKGSRGFPNLPARLRRLREERGFSQDELAARASLAQGSISLYESASRTPSAEVLAKLADGMGVSVSHLLEGTAPEQLEDPDLQVLVRDLRALTPELRAVVKDLVKRLREFEEGRSFVARERGPKYETRGRLGRPRRKPGA